MDKFEEKAVKRKNGYSSIKKLQEHLTILNLSNRIIKTIENVALPTNVTELNLSNNALDEVPVSVLNLENLKVLDFSNNCIKYFDDTPKFCHTIQSLDISNNHLNGPPYWVWSESPTNLRDVNLSCNSSITKSFHNGFYEELLEFKTPVTNIKIFNCILNDHMDIIGTFPKAKSLVLGTTNYSFYCCNKLEEVPCNGMYKCCDLQYLDLSYTNIYIVNPNIKTFIYLKEINLSHNKLDSLPEEFCLLENLETCILSYNQLFSLPASFCNLSKLINLSAECNELYSVPIDICKLQNIKRLDVYDNFLYEAPKGIERLLEVDLAQNYFEEPDDEDYLEKRKIIRMNYEDRCDGRKEEEHRLDSEHSKDVTDDELFLNSTKDDDIEARSSSPEDWDSDDYWVPHMGHIISRNSGSMSSQSTWMYFVKKKIEEGNFCPIDAHSVPVVDQIRYARLCNPKTDYETDGQFDDLSDDDN